MRTNTVLWRICSAVFSVGLVLAAVTLLVPVTRGLTMASSIMLLGIAAGTAVICEAVRRRFLAGKSVRPGLLRGVVPLGLLLAFLAILGIIAYARGGFPIRNAAVAVVIGGVAGGATCCVLLPMLIALLAAGRRDRGGHDGAVVAELVTS